MKWYDRLEKFMGRDWWMWTFGFTSATAVFQACMLVIVPTLLNALRDAGVI